MTLSGALPTVAPVARLADGSESWHSIKHSVRTDILVDVGPVDSGALTDQFVVYSLLRRRMPMWPLVAPDAELSMPICSHRGDWYLASPQRNPERSAEVDRQNSPAIAADSLHYGSPTSPLPDN
jgi:hypothetical protein